jgi:HlyD family secretion protein
MDRQRQRRRFPPRRLATIAGVLLFAGLSAYGLLKDSGVRKLNVERDKLTVSTVRRGPFLEYTPVRGTVLPIRTIYLDALESGQVERVFVEEGATVAEGEPLLRLANPSLELHVLQQESELERRREELRTGRLSMQQNLLRSRQARMELEYQLSIDKGNYERYASLSKQDLVAIMPLQDYEKLRNEHDYKARKLALTQETHAQDSLLTATKVTQLVSALARKERNLEIVRRRLDNLTLRAPVSGQLTTLDAEIGESKGAGGRLGQIDIVDGFKVRAAIDEHYIARVNRGQRGEFDLEEKAYGMTIRKVYPGVQNGRFEVDLVFEGEAPTGIRRGQTLHIRLELGDLEEAVQLARGGFYQTTGGHWVYVLDAAGERATRRDIKLGRQNPRLYEVLEGLEPGEQVITSSYDNFGENMDVLVLQ